MDGTRTHLRLVVAADDLREEEPAFPVSLAGAGSGDQSAAGPDPVEWANRELIRPPSCRRAAAGYVPGSVAWFDELEQKRYQRHGAWLPAALEFGRHPGESILLLGPGLGSDAIRYHQSGSVVTVGLTRGDPVGLVRDNLARHGLPVRLVTLNGPGLPLPDAHFDVVTWNALYDPAPPDPVRVAEVFRVLKAGGKVIGLFAARYDAGYWQDLLLPLQRLYWRRPPDPVSGYKTSGRELRRLFAGFHEFRLGRRHLRRTELPHLWRLLPLGLLERLIGRVLVLKAFKPLTARTGPAVPRAA